MTLQTGVAADAPVASMIIRGEVITDNLVEVGGRGGDLRFFTPDARCYLDRLPLGNPAKLKDLYGISFDEIVEFLDTLGRRLRLEDNAYLQVARELSYRTAPTTPPLVDRQYERLWRYFQGDSVREVAEQTAGVRYLEGWVEHQTGSGMTCSVRCFGARTLHIVAGNSPAISAMSILRNAILRSDAIIKAPSNDPFTALAIAQTMVDFAPDHPLTKHLTVAYWRGGDAELEEKLYQPHNVEKIVAWGGFASLKHVTRYIQPGLELISLDPKRSASVIGSEAFGSEAAMAEAAQRLAADIGSMNQVACVNSRVSYVMSGTDAAGVERLNRFGRMVYDALLALPPKTSTTPKRYDPDLKEHVDAARLSDDWYNVIGGRGGEGAVIVSQLPEPVEFATLLNDRTANLVPVDSVEDFVGAVNAYTQTVGVYPESLKAQLLDELPLYGVQRFVSLGYATVSSGVTPQDGIEVIRRMGKWIVNEACDPERVTPPWAANAWQD
jgi:hypothetical protein